MILLDIRMPGIGGLEVCRRIKARAEWQHIPLMFISASAEPEEQVEGLALGAVDFVSKPFQREELLARVRTHLELDFDKYPAFHSSVIVAALLTTGWALSFGSPNDLEKPPGS